MKPVEQSIPPMEFNFYSGLPTTCNIELHQTCATTRIMRTTGVPIL